MIEISSQHLDQVRDILRQIVPGVEVLVFGSRVHGKAKPHSDLDLVLRGDDKISDQRMGELQESFSESDLPFRVDLVDWNGISPEFQKVIEERGFERL
jgi:predicted nucleotidyltransferase